MNNENATSVCLAFSAGCSTKTTTDAAMTIARIPTPDTGLFDAPIRPAMNPQIAAIRNPPNNTNGSAITVSLIVSADSTVGRRKATLSHATTTRQTIVSAPIQNGE